MERYLLSIDAGTSMVKAILFDMEGRIAARADRPCQLICPAPDRYEIDLEAFYQRLCESIGQCLAHGGITPLQVAGVGVSAYMTGSIFLDGQHRQVGENIVWIDARTAPMLREWERSGLAQKSYGLTGTSLLPGSTLPLMCWWKRKAPQVLDKARCVLYMKDWIRFKLTGEICTDPSEATCLPADTFGRGWSREVMALYGMEEYMHLLPPIRPSDEIVGAVTRQAAKETGLMAGTPVICGLGDMLAGVLGAGALTPGQGVTILGSTLLNSVILDRPDTRPHGIGMTLATVEGKWARFLNNTGGGTINIGWAMDTLTAQEKASFFSKNEYYAWVDDEIRRTPPCSGGVMYHPYINSTGVTAPFYCVGARAQFTGIGLHSTRFHLMRSVYEGVAMAMRDCYGAVEGGIDQIRVSGGGSRSKVLCQIIADVCQKELLLPREAESTALGTAVMTACAVGAYGGIEQAAARMITISARYEPNPTAEDIYDAWFSLFQRTAQAMIPVWEDRMKVIDALA